MQLLWLRLAFNPISNKEKSIFPVKCKPGVCEPYPLQIAVLTEEVTAAQYRHAPEDGVLAPDPCAVRNEPY